MKKTPKTIPSSKRAFKIVKVLLTDSDGDIFEYSSVREAALAICTSHLNLRLAEQHKCKCKGCKVEFIRKKGNIYEETLPEVL